MVYDPVFYRLPDDLEPYVDQTYDDGSKYYISHKIINENRVVFVVRVNPFLYSIKIASRLDLGIYDDSFDYKTKSGAIEALNAWDDINSEPNGWFRHLHSGRRREYNEDGTVRKEWYQL